MITHKNRLPVAAGVGYISAAPHKTGAGFSLLPNKIAHNRASGFFTCKASSHFFRIMVGRMGALSSAPVSILSGKANPVRLTTHSISLAGGEIPFIKIGASSWPAASIPAPTLNVSTHRPKSIVVCSAPIPSPEPCTSIYCAMTREIFHRITSQRSSATWLTICAVCKNWRERRESNPSEELTPEQRSASVRWWGVCLSDIQEAL